MGDPRARRRPLLWVYAMGAGVHFAVLQTCWFLLLEASLSARAVTWFITLLFWLLGLLVGLQLPPRWRTSMWLGAGVVAWYVALSLSRCWPYQSSLYVVGALGSMISGIAPGSFFAMVGTRWSLLRRGLLHENNGFLVGLLIGLRGALHFESSLLAYGPAISGLLVLVLATMAERVLARPEASFGVQQARQ